MRRTCLSLSCLAIVMALSAGPVAAEEILYFTNGTSMPISSHEIRGEMIHVDLGSDSFMAFPKSVVEKIEEASGRVVLAQSLTGGNRITRGKIDNAGSFPMRSSNVPSKIDGSQKKFPDEIAGADPKVEVDENSGLAVYRPFMGDRASNRRLVGLTGHERARGASGYTGTRRVGSRHVIGGTGTPTRGNETKPPKTGLEQREYTPPTGRPGKGRPADRASSSESGSDSGSGD